jgi:hypothetical protein
MTDTTDAPVKGAFVSSLQRNNKQIRNDRAEAIAEEADVTFKRVVEDLQLAKRRLERQRENMLDLSPDHGFSLMLGKDFDAAKFVEEEQRIGIELRELDIKLNIMVQRYEHLFGGE